MQANNKPKARTKAGKLDEKNQPVRLNKILADAGVCSRRKADELISAGAVKVNSQVVSELGSTALVTDFITVNGNPIAERGRKIYILLNKPKNIITTTSDELGRRTVLDIVRKKSRLFPVGRLDRNTTGALLLTNDGELANRLTHPSYQIERTYSAKLDKELLHEDAKAIAGGIELSDEEESAPCEIYINPEDGSKVIIMLKEGKNREVRRIFEKFGYEVKQLDRKYFANLSTSGLDKGKYRHLTIREVTALKRLVRL